MPFPGLAKSLPPLLLGLTLTSLDSANAFELFLGTPELPEVLTATRLKQAPAAVPGSISVLDRELIQASGARELTELLRLVPGMIVVTDDIKVQVNYHGGHAAQARRMQVLIDGRSVYRPGLAEVDWKDLPVSLEDIERIEVFRGPNTVSYGANALTGVVNIITRRPEESLGTRVTYTHGQRGIRDGYARHGFAWDGGALRASVSSREDTGFDHRSNGSDFHDDIDLQRFNLSGTQMLADNQSLAWQLAFTDGRHDDRNHHRPTLDVDLQPGERDEFTERISRNYAASLRWDWDINPNHSLYIQSSLQHWERIWEWRSCDATVLFSPELRRLYREDPAYTMALIGNNAPLGYGTAEQQALGTAFYTQVAASYDPVTKRFAHTCGDLNENARESRFDLEVQDTLNIADNLRLVGVLNYRRDEATSEAYFSGSRHKDIGRLYGQVEWYPHHQWILQAGAMYEYDSMLADDSLTPRLAVNYLPTPAHGFRAVYTQAVRTPDMLELSADWQVYVRNLEPAAFGQREAYFFLSNRVDGNLRQERIESRELGYNGHFMEWGLHLDVRIYKEKIHDLITYWAKIADLIPTNRNTMDFHGWEIEANWKPGPHDRLRLTYSRIELDASHEWDSWYTPRHSGSLSWLHEWGNQLDTGATYLKADAINGQMFERLDLSVTKRWRLSDTTLLLSGSWQQRLDNNGLAGRAYQYDEPHVYWLSAGVEL
ncbi:TonB-dependent receptor plug domain-containing protein [Pseudomonas flexibilis]|uniref:TonB-dependent receptor n=1 Tax=Pseudomonas flexibilis TaxID=706570 RepID=A0A0B3BXS8_9PSED|nr:TonB-dependent receptor [Pseudomonas flexibilis]KHO65876.1 hypothetical protein PT85_07525 [Pseudomonas flexibilis]SCX75581.1 iron complex outermembrane recepter protein [Pseudomonas flexibilis]